MDFFPSTGSKCDLLVMDRSHLPELSPALARLRPQIITTPHYRICVFGFPTGIAVGDVVFSGMRYGPDRIEQGPCLLRHWPDQAGEWCAAELGARHVRLEADFFGFQPLYYGQGLASNRLHLIEMQLRHTGQLRLNPAAAWMQTLYRHRFCQQQLTFETPIKGVRKLAQGAHLDIGDKTVCHHTHTPDTPLEPEAYWELIEQAAQEITGNVMAATRTYPRVHAALSGGRDSRAIFAALVATDQVDAVRLVTTERGGDLPVAHAIASRFGARYDKAASGIMIATPMTRTLDRFFSQQFFCNINWNRSTAQPVVFRTEEPTCHLGGGGGELYRGYTRDTVFTNLLQRDDFDSNGLISAIRAQLAKTGLVDPSLHAEMANMLCQTFEDLPGRSLSHKFDMHYVNFRNTYHFGNNTDLMNKGRVMALQSRALFRAALGLPDALRACGRAVFDVTRTLCEELAYIDYEKPQPAYWTLPYHRPSHYDGGYIPISAFPLSSTLGTAPLQEGTGNYIYPVKRLKENIADHGRAYLRAHLESAHTSLLGQALTPKAWEQAERAMQRGSGRVFNWTAHTAMMRHL